MIFTKIARLSNSLLFLPSRICCADKIKLISVQQNNLMQYPNSRIALSWNWDGITNAAKAINARVANLNYNFRDPFVMLEAEYVWNGWVKKDKVSKYSYWICF